MFAMIIDCGCAQLSSHARLRGRQQPPRSGVDAVAFPMLTPSRHFRHYSLMFAAATLPFS